MILKLIENWNDVALLALGAILLFTASLLQD